MSYRRWLLIAGGEIRPALLVSPGMGDGSELVPSGSLFMALIRSSAMNGANACLDPSVPALRPFRLFRGLGTDDPGQGEPPFP